MKIKLHNRTSDRTVARITKKIRIRRKVSGTAERPRLCVYRSTKHMYAQIFDDTTGKCLLTVSSLKDESKSGVEQATWVGSEIAKQAKAKGISTVVFDRNGFIYHGRVKALADGARSGGLTF